VFLSAQVPLTTNPAADTNVRPSEGNGDMRIIELLVCSFLLMCSFFRAQTSSGQRHYQRFNRRAIPGAADQSDPDGDRRGSAPTTIGADGTYVAGESCASGPICWKSPKRGSPSTSRPESCFEVDSNPTVEIPMKVGAVSEQVTVEAGGCAGGNAQHQALDRWSITSRSPRCL